MNQHFAYAIDNRYLPVLVPFGLRRTKDGVTLTDDLVPGDLRLLQTRYPADKHHRRAHYPELPLVDRVRCARVTC